jgi:DNA-directed RNA polymerase subunit F
LKCWENRFLGVFIITNNLKILKIKIMKTQRLNSKSVDLSSVQSENECNTVVENANIQLQVEKTKSKKSTDLKSATFELLAKVDNSFSKKYAKVKKEISGLFSTVRSEILAKIANVSKMKQFDKNPAIETLRKSKKDTELYRKLCDIAPFDYAIVKTTNDSVLTLNFKKFYTENAINRACEYYNALFIQLVNAKNKTEIIEKLISDIKHEHELQALKKVENSIDSISAQCATILQQIAATKEDEKTVLNDLNDKLINLQNRLLIQTKSFEYLKIQSNRQQIK